MGSFSAHIHIILLCLVFAHFSLFISKPLGHPLKNSNADFEKKANLKLSTQKTSTSRRNNRTTPPQTHRDMNSIAFANLRQKVVKKLPILNPSKHTFNKSVDSNSEKFKVKKSGTMSRATKNQKHGIKEASPSHVQQKTTPTLQTKTSMQTKMRPTPNSTWSSTGVKPTLSQSFIPISLRTPGGHLDAQMVLPNFFTHVLNHRDMYRLAIPEKSFATVRITNDSFKNVSLENTTHTIPEKNESGKLRMEHVNTTIAILQQIIGRMRTRSTSAPPLAEGMSQKFVQIGHTRVSEDRVTDVGDIDQNGIVDLVVSSPGKNRKRGSARLYLMGKNNSFLYSRELVPGQWGFDAPPLHPGDLFGSVVHALPVASPFGSYSLIAIGAPGDLQRESRHEGEYLNERAHVYVMKVSRKGNVLSNVQLPLEEFEKLTGKYAEAIRRLEAQESGNRSDQHKHNHDDVHDFKEESKFLDAVEGVRTITFKTAKGEVRAVIRVDDERGKKLLLRMDKYVLQVPASRLETTYLGEAASNPLQSNDSRNEGCIYSDHKCACKLVVNSSKGEKCYGLIGKTDDDGSGVCDTQPCKLRYTCTCDGSHLCRRETRTVSSLKAVGTNAEGQTLCKTRPAQRTIVEVIDHVSAKPLSPQNQSIPNFSLLPAYNETHCACSIGQESEASTERCFQYVRTIEGRAIVCKEKECDASVLYECDWSGMAYCRHYQQTMQVYLNDGGKRDEPGHYYCHREEIKRTIVEYTL